MFSTGSKFFYGAAVAAFVAAFFFAIATADHAVGMASFTGALTLGYKGRVGDHVGYGILVAAGGVALFLGGVASAIRDGDPEAIAQVAGLDEAPPVQVPSGTSYWPLLAAFGAAITLLGVVVKSPFFILGLVILGLVAVEWTVRVWSDQATGDAVANRAARNRMLNPIEIPVIALIGIALFVLSISRILLALPEGGSYFVFGGVPLMLFAIAILLNARPQAGRSVVTTLLVLGAAIIIGGGIAGLVHGRRHIEPKDKGQHLYHLKGQSIGPVAVPGVRTTGVTR
jgi:hypothetical protein